MQACLGEAWKGRVSLCQAQVLGGASLVCALATGLAPLRARIKGNVASVCCVHVKCRIGSFHARCCVQEQALSVLSCTQGGSWGGGEVSMCSSVSSLRRSVSSLLSSSKSIGAYAHATRRCQMGARGVKFNRTWFRVVRGMKCSTRLQQPPTVKHAHNAGLSQVADHSSAECMSASSTQCLHACTAAGITCCMSLCCPQLLHAVNVMLNQT